jgi:hypothetical protein
MGIDIGKYAFHVVGLDRRGAIVLRRLEGAERFALPPPPAIASVGTQEPMVRRLFPGGTRSRAGCGKGCEPPTFMSRPMPRPPPRRL